MLDKPLSISPYKNARLGVFLLVVSFATVVVLLVRTDRDALMLEVFGKTYRSHVTVVVNGSVSNQMSQYASLLALKSQINRIRIHLDVGSDLRRYFNISAQTLPAQTYLSWSSNSPLAIKESDNALNLNPGVFVLNSYRRKSGRFDNVREAIRKDFTFKSSVAMAADEFLKKVASIYGNTPRSTFVGVHVKRAGEVAGVATGREYFVKAMHEMKKKYGDVIYVVCSDDIGWCKRNLADVEKKTVFSEGHEAITDMAILSKCNHSIISSGSFGFWSAFLANGTTIYSKSNELANRENFHYSRFIPPDWMRLY